MPPAVSSAADAGAGEKSQRADDGRDERDDNSFTFATGVRIKKLRRIGNNQKNRKDPDIKRAAVGGFEKNILLFDQTAEKHDSDKGNAHTETQTAGNVQKKSAGFRTGDKRDQPGKQQRHGDICDKKT